MKTFGQNEIAVSSTMPELITRTIVRNYQNGEVVTYVQSSRNNIFTLTDAQNYNKYSAIDSRYVVNDCAIYQDTMYFCGKNNFTNTGFIGYYNINDFFSGTGSYYILDNLPSDSLSGVVEELNKMIVYKNDKELNVTCIGIDDSYRFQTCIINFLPWTTSGINYSVGVVLSSSSQYLFLDITHTDKYVVVTDLLNGSGIPSLRAFDINNLLVTGGIHDYLYAYSDFLDNKIFNHNNMLIEHVNNDTIVTATYWKDLYSPYQYDGTNIRVYDINQMIGMPYMGMLYSYGISQPCSYGYWQLFELKNDPVKRCLYLLQKTEPIGSTGTEYMISEIEYTSPTSPINNYFLPNYEFHSLDLFPPYYIVTGTDAFNRYDEKFYSKIPLFHAVCSQSRAFTYNGYSISRQKKEHSPLCIFKKRIKSRRLEPKTILELPFDIECVD